MPNAAGTFTKNLGISTSGAFWNLGSVTDFIYIKRNGQEFYQHCTCKKIIVYSISIVIPNIYCKGIWCSCNLFGRTNIRFICCNSSSNYICDYKKNIRNNN